MSEMDQATREELEECIEKMKAASAAFYTMAIYCNGNHAFIEFTGLMNEYINVCEDRLRAGIDFRHLNKHSGNEPLAPYRLAYLNEKIDCIYGVEFRPDAAEDNSHIPQEEEAP